MRAMNTAVEKYRLRDGSWGSDASYGNNGVFVVPRGTIKLRVIVSDQNGWDHVSVSLPDRCPTWEEMQHVRDLFFANEEWVVQYSPPKSAHISFHNFCLHMWRKQPTTKDEFNGSSWVEIPPAWMIAPVVPEVKVTGKKE